MTDPVARTPRMRATDRRAQVLEAARQIVAGDGYHAVTIEAVARAAGISRPIVYEHFGDLEGLLRALVDRIAEDALAQLDAVLPRSQAQGPPGALLLASFEAYLRAACSDPVTWKVVLMPPEGAPPYAREKMAEGRQQVVGRLTESLGLGFMAGHGSPDPELTARALSTVADEAVRLVLLSPANYPVERVLKHAAWLLGHADRDELRRPLAP
ncbi:MAG: TetR/AcrR family transcriptional regulator [Candidatus Dormibacteria bacterium]